MISFYSMPVIFIAGIMGIAFEDKIKINKSAIALIMCVCLWVFLLADGSIAIGTAGFTEFTSHYPASSQPAGGSVISNYISTSLTEHLGDVSGTLFFVLCSMVLVNTIDNYGGFKAITAYLSTTDKRSLLWRVAFASFFFSAFLDNLAAAIVIIAILRKLVPDRTDRLKYACMCIISCNAGGSWSPIGDVTTLLLWTNGRITPLHQITHVFVPALINMLVPLIIAHFWLFKKKAKLRLEAESSYDEWGDILPNRARRTVFWVGIGSLMLIPFYQTFFNIPAFMGAIIGLVIIWVYTEIMFHKHKKRLSGASELRITNLLHQTDLSTIFYFLGILMSVAALETGGQLAKASTGISQIMPNTDLLAGSIGLLSSVLDNVALVAAVLGMYPVDAVTGVVSPFVLDGSFWTFLAYCAVTGGSLLIIGSATGVTVMGLEDISFGYYFKRFSALALLGYICGGVTFMLFA
ncbi:sodium:proton antiporter NhaD [Porphyromonas pogonae]|uniref:sodium:proton antiporter NhaD n=1 Tax=Porphyromonas pogonae TaxID=867595 RepID=UPI002E7A9FE7|nr:sodium:proton antiporter NhaD [Porphyromonas pogonae]